MASPVGGELTHEEVWDDSELVRDWNEALEEYKKYHSLAARGEKVQPVESDSAAATTNGATNAPVNFTPASAALPPAQEQVPSPPLAAGPANTGPAGAPSVPMAPPGPASLPQAVLSPTLDDALKNIMMSWYYAGYYTGLYEGQQKAWASMQETHPN